MEPVEIFRNNIRHLIEQSGLTQLHIAGGIGESPQKLNDYLKGRINWGEQKRLKLSNFLKVDYHSLYNEKFTAGVVATIGISSETGYEIIRKQTGPKQDTGREHPKDTEKPAQPDPDLLAQVIEGVEGYLHDHRRALEPKLKAQLVSLLYDYFSKTGEKVDKRKVESYLKLVA
ncbi:MAG: helix-turn-helix domain-containing protein [Deltaproteobacteria bacterium]|nr:helix-turn-helix domain-containing protein [Deltaproteobacteria bacterium]